MKTTDGVVFDRDSAGSALDREPTALFGGPDRQEGGNPRPAASPAEVDGHGDKDSVALKQPTLDDVAGTGTIDQPEDCGVVDDPSAGDPDDAGEPAAAADETGDMGEDNPGTSLVTLPPRGKDNGANKMRGTSLVTLPPRGKGNGANKTRGTSLVTLPPRGETEAADDVIGPVGSSAPNDDGHSDDESGRPQLSTSLKLPEAFDWRKLKPRQYGKSLPPLHPSERQTLKESIISRGFVGSRILIDEKNNVIDGNTRLEICMETGIAPVVEKIQGLSEDEEQRELEKEGLALSFNRDRRHLDKEDAAKVFEASLDNLLDRRRKDKKLTQQRIAAELGVSVSTVSARERFRHDSAGGTMSKPDVRRKYDDELKHEAVRLVKEGIAKADVARQLCMSPKAVERAEKEEKEREAGGAPAKGGKRKKAAAAKPLEPMADISASNGLPELHRRANEHLKRDDHAYIERLKADAAQARKDVEAVSDIDELQDLSLSYSLTLAFVDQRLRKKLPGASRPNTAGIESDPVLLGIVMAYEQEEVFVALSSGGGGVIDNRGDFLAMYGPPKADEVVRVRVEGFDWKRGLWKLQPQARQTVAPAPGAIAGSDRNDRCRPDTKLAGLKAGPKNKEVTK